MSTRAVSTLSKSLRLFSVALVHPLEGYDRIHTLLEVRRQRALRPEEYKEYQDYPCRDQATGLAALESAAGIPLRSHLSEMALTQLQYSLESSFQEFGDAHAPFDGDHNADARLAGTCYAIARGLRPTLVVETGVCYGVSSACLLQALRQNRHGHLHSIDLPPLAKDADHYVGTLVPANLRSRWTLHRGTALRLLPTLLQHLGQIDLFLHDSLHTYEHMRFEFDAAWEALRPGGLLIADDIERNRAFLEFATRPDVRTAVVMRFSEGDALFGVAVK